MKRILCLIESLGSGGAERQLTGLAVMLKQRDYQVEVCYYIKNEFYLKLLQIKGVDNCFLSKAKNPCKRFIALRKHIKTLNPNTVISYSVSPSMITCILKMLGAKFNLIVSERNTTQQLTFREKLRFFLYRWSDCIVPNSQSQADFIRMHFSNLSSKIFVITNFVDTTKFSPASIAIPEHKETRMVCVGRLMPQKNIPRFIEAISKVVTDGFKIHVNWFGQDFEKSYTDICFEAIRKYNLESNFEFHAPSQNIQEEYLRADVFCLPSVYEGFPNVLCEAMSCGKPVLCSRVCDNPNIVQEGVNGFMFNPCEPEDMASAIEKFILLPYEKKMSMAQKGREIALELFSSESFINKYLKIVR